MDWEELSRRKVLAGIASAGGTGAIVGQGTAALFSDEETFTNNTIEASNNVAGVVDIDVTVEKGSDEGEVVFVISLPEDDSADVKDVNNNPSHVWVRSVDCPPEGSGGSDLNVNLVLECDGSEETLQSDTRLGDVLSSDELRDGRLLGCDPGGNTSDPEDCLRPGETRKLKIRPTQDPSILDEDISFTLKFYAQQCRYNTEPEIQNPFSDTGPESCSPPPTPGPDFCLFPCPVDPLSDLPVPLEYDNSLLPEDIKNDSVSEFKKQLNEIDGITLTSEVIDRDELTDISSVREQDRTGDIDISKKAIVGPTDGENVIDVGGGSVTVSNHGAIIGTFTNTGGNDVVIGSDSAVAGDIGVSAAGGLKGTGNVEIKSSSTVVGDINTNTDGKNIKVKSGTQDNRSQVFGNAITSGSGKITVQYGRVSESVETDGGGNVTVKDYSRVDGDAITSGGGQITVGNSNPSQVGGTADSTGNGNGNIDLNGVQQDSPKDTLPDEPAKVLDGVRAGGQANLSEGSVKNGVVADGDVVVDNSVVCGSVVSDGNIDLDKFSLIQEDRNASQDIGIDLDNFNIVTPTGELGTNFDNFGTSTDGSTANQTIRAGSVIAGKTIGGLQNSFVGGDVIAKNGDIDVPSSVICGDVVAENGAIDIYSEKTGPPLGLDLDGQQGGSRSQDRQRSLIGGVVRVEGEDFDIASATVFANGTTEPDKYDDDIAVLVTQKASGGDDSTITGGSILKGDVVVDGDLNVDIDGGSRVEGKVEANAGTVSLNDVTVTGPDPDAVDDDALIIGDGGKIDQLNGDATIQGNVRVKSGGTLAVSGPATIEGDLIVKSGGTANEGSVTVEGNVIRQ